MRKALEESIIEFDRTLGLNEITDYIGFISDELECLIRYNKDIGATVNEGENIDSVVIRGCIIPKKDSIYTREKGILVKFKSEFDPDDFTKTRAIRIDRNFDIKVMPKGYRMLWENVREATKKYFSSVI